MSDRTTSKKMRKPWVTKDDFEYERNHKDYHRHLSKDNAAPTPMEELRKWIRKWVNHHESSQGETPKQAGTTGTYVSYVDGGAPYARTRGIQQITDDGLVMFTNRFEEKSLYTSPGATCLFHSIWTYKDQSCQMEMHGSSDPLPDREHTSIPKLRLGEIDGQQPIVDHFRPHHVKFTITKHYDEEPNTRMSAIETIQYDKKGDTWEITENPPVFAYVEYP